jgi:isopenicillin N synthase-like dioxygenase
MKVFDKRHARLGQDGRVIPVVDLRDSAGGRGAVARRIAKACEHIGFFAITEHGIPDAVLRESRLAMADYFALPLETKMRDAISGPDSPYGYSPLEGESLAATRARQAGARDHKESFSIGPTDRAGLAANRWPAAHAAPELRRAFTARYRAMAQLASLLLADMAQGVGLPRGWFVPLTDRGASAQRALHYPVGAEQPGGAAAHTDYGTLTILETDPAVAGLEVLLGRRWHAVEVPPGALVVNIGDAMARWTCGRWRSTVHRVVMPSGARGPRQSCAFFHNANADAIIAPLPGLAPRRSGWWRARRGGEDWAPVRFGDYLEAKVRAAYGPPKITE